MYGTDVEQPLRLTATLPHADQLASLSGWNEQRGSATLVFGWLNRLREARRQDNRRAYYALREAQALRMQFGSKAEARCEKQITEASSNSRRERFLRLVRKALETV